MTIDDFPTISMSDTPSKPTAAEREAERRRERAAKQLRMNLQRRKQQVRARREGAADMRADGLLVTPDPDSQETGS